MSGFPKERNQQWVHWSIRIHRRYFLHNIVYTYNIYIYNICIIHIYVYIYIPRKSKYQTLVIGSRQSFTWSILKTILCLVLDFQVHINIYIYTHIYQIEMSSMSSLYFGPIFSTKQSETRERSEPQIPWLHLRIWCDSRHGPVCAETVPAKMKLLW